MKKMLPALLLAFCLSGLKQEALACSCFYLSDYFCVTLSEGSVFGGTPHITFGRVLNKYVAGPNQAPLMDIEIVEWLKTEDPSPDTISVLGQDGLNCNESLSYFAVGDTVILALGYYGDGWHPIDISPHRIYNLSGCGRYFLHYTDGYVTGPIRPGVSDEPFADFKSGLETCILLTDTEEIPEEDVLVSLYPNPANDQLNLKIGSRIGAPDRLYFLNAYGQTISLKATRSEDGLITGVDVSALSPGLYFVVLEYGNSRRTKKWIKV
jgi:hypothetical protein